MKEFQGKSILVTGACGSVGSALTDELVRHNCKSLILIDNNETELFFLDSKLSHVPSAEVYLCDIRDRASIDYRMRGVDVIIHAAALKHVGICERSPDQAVQTNILGTQNLIDSAIENNVQRFLFTSSDKAVNPTNVMGGTKLLGEKLISAAAERVAAQNGNGPIFFTTRFGNVLGSRGSVFPIFEKQILAKEPITVTHEEMTRFIMSTADAAKLVLSSVWRATGGEILVTKMLVAYIKDLAVAMNNIMGGQSDIRYIGVKSGEKMYEELVNDEEIRRTVDYGEFLRIAPLFELQNLQRVKSITKPFNSANERKLDVDAVSEYLKRQGLLDKYQVGEH
jgi:FlaA1/EpsC-like NDP-sugar epimerase